MPRKIASLDQLTPPQVQTQKQILIDGLENHIAYLNGIIQELEKAQTQEELTSTMQTAAKNII